MNIFYETYTGRLIPVECPVPVVAFDLNPRWRAKVKRDEGPYRKGETIEGPLRAFVRKVGPSYHGRTWVSTWQPE